MANPEHLALLKSDKNTFNAWRDECPDVQVDLSVADLYGMDLRGYNLSEAGLQGANLQWTNMRGAKLQGANLRLANLRGANLQGANLIVGAQDTRGYQSLLTYNRKPAEVQIQFGCQLWDSFDAARAHFGPGYDSDGDPDECLLILDNLEARYKLRMKQGADNG